MRQALLPLLTLSLLLGACGGGGTERPAMVSDQIQRLNEHELLLTGAYDLSGFLIQEDGVWKTGDQVDQQWGKAIGGQKIIHIEDEQRAVDYAMGLIARAWGHFGDFKDNMRARQDESKVLLVSKPIELKCPLCGAPIPLDAKHRFSCVYCGATLKL